MTATLFTLAVALTSVYALLAGCAADLAASVGTVYAAGLFGLWGGVQLVERTRP